MSSVTRRNKMGNRMQPWRIRLWTSKSLRFYPDAASDILRHQTSLACSLQIKPSRCSLTLSTIILAIIIGTEHAGEVLDFHDLCTSGSGRSAVTGGAGINSSARRSLTGRLMDYNQLIECILTLISK